MGKRKYHNVVLPEVRKPARYGTLISVVAVDESTRELWFQHPKDPTIIRCVEIDLANSAPGKPMTIKAKGERNR